MKIFTLALILTLAVVSVAIAQDLPDLGNIDLGGGNWQDWFQKIVDFLGKLLTPIKEVVKVIGNLLIWILELTVQLIKLGFEHL